MEFRVLGPLEVRGADGAEVVVGAPKMRVLLCALLLEAGRVVTADWLVDAVWDESPPPQPLVSLRSYVSNLRRLLAAPDGTNPIETRGPGYVLAVAPEQVDLAAFEHEVREARRRVADEPGEALALLDRALGRWRGPALADVADLPFARAEVARLEQLRVAALEDRVDALLAAGRPEAVAEAEALVVRDPLRERPRRQLMLGLHRAGRGPEALEVLRDFRGRLGDELGLDPTPAIEGLADRILRGDPALELPVAPAPAPVVMADTGTSMVGRERERRRLAEAVAALPPRGAVLRVAGEAGIGKTTLLDDLAARAAGAGVLVARGRCPEAAGSPPFWPWAEVVRGVAAALDDDALAVATAGHAAAVAVLAPEVAARTGRAHDVAAADPLAARFALHDAVSTYLARAAAGRGLVVCLDDLHWGDLASCELAGIVAATAADAGIVLAVAHRDTPADGTDELALAVDQLVRAPGATTLGLDALPLEDIASLVAGVAGADLADDEAVARAGGNPFLARQVAELLAAGDGDEQVPRGVREVMRRRLARLSEGARDTLGVASVLGDAVDPALVARCRGLASFDVLDDLDLAVDHGLLVRQGRAGYRFAHALVRDAVVAQLPVGRVLRLHVAAADALEEQPVPPAARVAEHLWEAADLVPPDRPVRWLLAAAEEAVALFAHEQAEALLRRALHLATHATGDAALELAVRLQLVQVLVGLHGWTADQVAEVVAPTRALAGGGAISPRLIPLWWSMWTMTMTRGALREARELAHELLDDARTSGEPAALVAGHVAVAYSELYLGLGTDGALAHVEQAETHEAEADPADLAVTAEHLSVALQITRAMAHAHAGNATEALKAIDEAVDVARARGTVFAQAYARMFGGYAAAAVDRPEQAVAHTARGLELCETAGLVHVANLTVPAHAWGRARTGHDPRAEADRIAGAEEGLTAVGHLHALPQTRLLLARVRHLAGDREAALAALHAAEDLVVATGEDVYGAQMVALEAELATSA